MPNSLNSEFLRPIATHIGPGALALFGITAIWIPPAEIVHYLATASALAGILLFVGSVILGFLLEDIASHFENGIYESTKGEGDDNNWQGYLCFDNSDSVGRNYVRITLTRLKFELSMLIAMLANIPWLIKASLAARTFEEASFEKSLLFFSTPILLWLHWEAKQSIRVLADARGILVRDWRERQAEEAAKSDQPKS
ncbi:hypothetical protein [Planctopirus hydrillae]|uniref:hypothetical protein n=1 Tax=Planctopirus hydrillae TaxID=1841610 RepID=UPI0010426AE9|nr:hypothetical protein [Planctopirus hydrillae]